MTGLMMIAGTKPIKTDIIIIRLMMRVETRTGKAITGTRIIPMTRTVCIMSCGLTHFLTGENKEEQ
jgi:hypothetical protein